MARWTKFTECELTVITVENGEVRLKNADGSSYVSLDINEDAAAAFQIGDVYDLTMERLKTPSSGRVAELEARVKSIEAELAAHGCNRANTPICSMHDENNDIDSCESCQFSIPNLRF